MTRMLWISSAGCGLLLVTRPPPLTVAEIHAGVLSILIAALFLYSHHRYERIHDYEERVFEAARQVNGLDHPGIFYYKDDEANLSRPWQDRRNALITSVRSVARKSGQDARQAGLRALSALSIATTAPPFPVRAKNAEDGPDITFEPISFARIDQVEEWANAVSKAGYFIHWTYNSHHPLIMRALKNADLHREYPGLLWIKSHGGEHPTQDLFQAIMRYVHDVQEVATATRSHIRDLSDFEKRSTDKRLLGGAFILSGIAFIGGVLAPLFATHLHPAIYVWLPSTVYAILGGWLVWLFLRPRRKL